jgi:tetratricopeptide (TPR) repeat protein
VKEIDMIMLLQGKEHNHVYFFHKKTLQEKQQGLVFDQHLVQDLDLPRSQPDPVSNSGVPSPQPQPAININAIMSFASQKLYNHLFTAHDNPNYDIALQCLHLVMQINEKKLSEARRLVAQITQHTGNNSVTCYFSGYLEMIVNHNEAAISLFRQALNETPEFWPARFHLAMLLRRKSPRKAYQEFMACEKSIRVYIDQDRRDYQFLLEGFNAKYFLNMCQKFTKNS